MAQGRVSAVAVVGLLCLLAAAKYAEAATYTVGDADGWTYNVLNWPMGKKFKAGDTLVFKYDPTFHNLVRVDKASYTSCTVPRRAKVLTSGNDKIRLSKGMNYFICGMQFHCQQGMQIAVLAA